MTSAAFVLHLNNAYWLDDDDLSAHGDITLLVNGVDIVARATNGWNLNWSSVRLLTSVFQDIPTSDHTMIACGCTIGPLCGSDICFAVHHHDGHVTLSDFENRHVEGGMEKFKGLAITLPWREYAEQVYDLAARSLAFLPEDRTGEDEWETGIYRKFRQEHSDLLEKLEKRMNEGLSI